MGLRHVILSGCAFMITLFMTLSATAYESDSHFDMMYHLSRAAGIADGTAKFLALANQHIDEKIISSPMLVSVQRQLFHFPGDIEKVNIEGHGIISLPAKMFKSKLALAERNSAIGNYMIYLGLVRGDLMLVGLGMHVKMDTYGHAGFSNIAGHVVDGHNPDRAFLEATKYEDMIRSLIQGLVAVRKLLPREAVDKESALQFLNKWAPKTHLKRELTMADMDGPQAATLISGVVVADDNMLGIYREDIFKKFEYKKFALKQVYEKFKRSGEINSKLSFEELFPDRLLQNRRMEAKDVLKYVIISTSDAEFLKAEGGKEIFNLQKLFGYQSSDIFFRKFKVEIERAEFRLREMYHLEASIIEEERAYEKKASEFQSYIESGRDKELYAGNQLQELREERQRIDIKTERLNSEKLDLLSGAESLSLNYEIGSEDYIRVRVREIAENRNAEEISIKLFKDLIPMRRTEYIKQNFEGKPDTRNFETEYKSEAHRLARIKNWGVNFLHLRSEKEDIVQMVHVNPVESGFVRFLTHAITKFRVMMRNSSTPAQVEEWKTLAQKSAAEYLDLDMRLAPAENAERLRLDRRNRRDAFFKLFSYVGPAMFPWLTGNISGYSYVKKIVLKAKLHAKDYEVENLDLAVAEGRYSADFLSSKKSKKAFDLIRRFEQSAVLQCTRLFN
ncbi:MAG: hypothetical protein A2622_06750 [Bdellovibrionales bacterium RIFCSPHIGHO2_01_FULL_40_29]|nr:MAG: hypothetical protein A2622_06750 [Bdellovibrionales bacterium RIFCSPHIGHO2_01_FULL_40_29]